MNQPVGHLVDGLIRYRIDLGYDGTEFWGWAKQPGYRTVQSVLVKALTQIFGESKNDFGLRVAGRTDAGVHALMQVAHFDLDPALLRRLGRNKDLKYKINTLLPQDVRIHALELAPEGFDARFSATFRRYRYRIADALAQKNPVQARFTMWTATELDILAMKRAALELYGLHDFASFCRAKPRSTTIRELREVNIARIPEDFNVIEVELIADAFCHTMVRSIMGGLIAAGQGKATPQDVADTLARKSRVDSFKVQPANGLTLMQIGYPPESEMGAQAERTRALRLNDDN